MFFYYLLAAHLIGDFALQTDSIARKKSKEPRWVLIHSLIVMAVMLVAAIPAGWVGMAMVVAAGISHFFIDLIKMRVTIKNQYLNFIYFIIDQTVHIWILWLIAESYQGSFPEIMEERWIILLDVVLFVVFTGSVCIQFVLQIPFARVNFYERNEKFLGIANRLCIYSCMLLAWYVHPVLLLFVPVWLVVAVLYYGKKLRDWMDKRYFVSKLLLDVVFSALGMVILIF